MYCNYSNYFSTLFPECWINVHPLKNSKILRNTIKCKLKKSDDFRLPIHISYQTKKQSYGTVYNQTLHWHAHLASEEGGVKSLSFCL